MIEDIDMPENFQVFINKLRSFIQENGGEIGYAALGVELLMVGGIYTEFAAHFDEMKLGEKMELVNVAVNEGFQIGKRELARGKNAE